MNDRWKIDLGEPRPSLDPYRMGHQEQYIVRIDPRTKTIVGHCEGMSNSIPYSDWIGDTIPAVFDEGCYPYIKELLQLFKSEEIQSALQALAELADNGQPARYTELADYIVEQILNTDCRDITVIDIDEFARECDIDDRILSENLDSLAHEIESWVNWEDGYVLSGDVDDIAAALKRRKEYLE